MSARRDLNALASRQFGVISRAQAQEAGFSPSAVTRRVRSGEWVRMAPGVFRLNSASPSWEQELMAAWMWAGRGAVVSHRSAGRIFRLTGVEDGIVEIRVPQARRSPRSGIVLHSGFLESKDVAVWGPLRLTIPTRTLIDLGAVLDEESLEVAMEDAFCRGLTSFERLERKIVELGRSGRDGVGIMRRLLELRGSAAPAESALEVLVVRAIRKSKLPVPVRQLLLKPGLKSSPRFDLAYPQAKVAVECDSFKHHSGRRDWDRERAKLSLAAELGWRVIHVTWDDIKNRKEPTMLRIGRAIGFVCDDVR